MERLSEFIVCSGLLSGMGREAACLVELTFMRLNPADDWFLVRVDFCEAPNDLSFGEYILRVNGKLVDLTLGPDGWFVP